MGDRIDPGFSPDALPIVLSSLSERIESVRAQEIFNYATYDQPETLFEVMGFGKPPGTMVPLLIPGALTMAWGPSVRMVAAARAAFAMGYLKIGTYTLPSEGGASLKASGWQLVGEAGGGSWDRENRKRTDKAPLELKHLWERYAPGAGYDLV